MLKVLDPPMVANRKSSPKRLVYAIGGAFLLGLLALGYIAFGKEKYHRLLS